MYVARLSFATGKSIDVDAIDDAIEHLMRTLRQNGQVCGKEFPIASTAEGYELTFMIPERTSLSKCHHNRYVRMGFEKLKEIGLTETKRVVTPELHGYGICRCKPRPSYVLYTDYASLEPPLRCGGCFRPVPLYRIPPTSDCEYWDIIRWQSYYEACDNVFQDGIRVERWALGQMYRLNSELTEDGLAICRRIEELTQIPVYYSLYKWNARSAAQDKKRLCPSCQGEWLLTVPWHKFDFKCDRCKLVSNFACSFP